MHDLDYMKLAISLAERGCWTTTPNPNVGCVIVKNAQIVGQGFHQRAGEAHAEVNALAQAQHHAKGATAYVTLEPCYHFGRTPPCVEALINAGIARVVVAMDDPNVLMAGKGIARLRSAGIAVDVGLMRAESEAINRGFLKRMRTGRPYVRLKLAASIDGRTAMASGESKWITSTKSRSDVQRYRAESCAILSTSETVISDDPQLTVRWADLPDEVKADYPESTLRQPVRVIIDSRQRLDPVHYRVFHQPGITYLVQRDVSPITLPPNVTQLVIPANNQIPLPQLLDELGKKMINDVWVEAGAKLAGSLIKQQLIDELIVYLAPKIIGQDGRSLCELNGITRLIQAPSFHFSDITAIAGDVRLTLVPYA